MALKSWLFKALGLLLSLWAAASALFLLSLLLPNASSPLGMSEPDVAVYGQSASSVRKQIKSEFQERKGLDKPLFYMAVQPLGKLKGENKSEILPELVQFSRHARLWHGEEATENFLLELQKYFRSNQVSPTEQTQVISLIATWASAPSAIIKKEVETQFLLYLEKKGQKRYSLLEISWQSLKKTSSPWWYFLPGIQWNGKDNQYHRWITEMGEGRLGTSLQDYSPVQDKVIQALEVSAVLALPGFGLALAGSFLIGLWLTLSPLSSATHWVKQVLYTLDSVPGFMITLGIFALYLLAGGTLSFPSTELGFTPSTLLGCGCIALFLLPFLSLFFHQNLQQEASKLYLRTAQAKGLSFSQAMLHHTLPNALASSVVVIGDLLASLLAGVLIVEVTFSLPGTGSLLAQSLLTQDYPTVIGLTLFFLLFRTLLMWTADIVNGFIDPRMKVQ